MQIKCLFTLLPLLALVAAHAQSESTAAVVESGKDAAYGESTNQNTDDNGDYHDEPETGDYEDDGDDSSYNKKSDDRKEKKEYKAVPKQTVVIVVAKSLTTSHSATMTTSGVAANSQVRYVSPAGHTVTPASSPYMLAINKTFALRINRKENDHIKKNRIYPHRTECLTVRRRGIHDRFKARMEHCKDDQRFWMRSPMSFHFDSAGNDKVYLTWMDPKGVKNCAHHDKHGTRFYPCNSKDNKPTVYEILPTKYTGKFKIKEAGHNRCFDAAHNNLWMNRCRGFDDQSFDIVTIAYDQN